MLFSVFVCIFVVPFLFIAKSAGVVEYIDFFFLQRGKPRPQMSVLDMTQNNLMVRF